MASTSVRAAETSAAPANRELAERASLTPAAGTAAFHMDSLDTYAEVLRRPLFDPDRRAHEAQAVAALPQQFTLRGIVVLPGATYALVEEGKTTRRVSAGQALGGGTVKEILHDRVVLNVNGVETAVKLFDPTANGKPTPGLSTAGGSFSQLPPGYQRPVPVSRQFMSGG